MILDVKNIAKIKDAVLELNGITVVAGENDTGKSTFGKVLYCLFNAFYHSSELIYKERIKSVQQILMQFRPKIITSNFNTYKRAINKMSAYILDKSLNLGNGSPNAGEIYNYLTEYLVTCAENFTEDIGGENLKIIAGSIQDALCIDDATIQKGIINSYFRNEFNYQINHINMPTSVGKISIQISNKVNSVDLISNECVDYSHNVNIISQAIYIDSPFVVDELTNYTNINHQNNLKDKLRISEKNNIINEAINKQKLQRIIEKLNAVSEGEFIDDSGELLYKQQGFKNPINLSNLSTGLKSFVIIKRLIENNRITENGLLILDEPEIHLHPEWQLKYAELLVLLQKEFNLNILLNTHSPYFLRAIEVFSDKYTINCKCKYYLASVENSFALIKDVESNTSIIYEKLANPFQILENIKYE